MTLVLAAFYPYIASLIRKLRSFSRLSTAVFLFSCIVATLYGGSKRGTISYPRTDADIAYLIDNGSYVSNDAVRVSFIRAVAPLSAPILIDYRPIQSTNELDWVNFTNTTFSAFNQPQTIDFESATNFNWVVYTTWTPGPSVITNGLFHAYWGLDSKKKTYVIPVRTSVIENSAVIAPNIPEE